MIQTWSGRSGRQHFSFAIHQNASYTFNWAFQKQTWAPEQPYGGVAMRLLDTDVARIYSINVTNTVEGGASQCLPCAQVRLHYLIKKKRKKERLFDDEELIIGRVRTRPAASRVRPVTTRRNRR